VEEPTKKPVRKPRKKKPVKRKKKKAVKKVVAPRKTKDLKSLVTSRTRARLDSRHTSLKADTRTNKKSPKHTKRYYLNFFEGYDGLSDFIYAWEYVRRTYKINIDVLEVLLYFYPKNYFVIDDFEDIPSSRTGRPYTQARRATKILERKGYFAEVTQGRRRGNEILYTLSPLAKSIVRNFYDCLSGEKKFTYTTLKTEKTAQENEQLSVIEQLKAKANS